MEQYYAVIMAGGGGTRLWPLSRRMRPKQLLRLFEDQSLFQSAVSRLNSLFPPDHIFVVTVAEQAALLQAQCPQIPPENFLVEAAPRGTASVVGLAAVALQQRGSQAVMAVLTSDHFIGNVEKYHALLGAAYDLAREDYLVTLGIAPTFPATGYGYIQQGEALGMYRGLQACRVLKFTEKPDEGQARAMLETRDHAWNSGMFVWKVEQILSEFERQMPELHATLQALSTVWGKPERPATLQHLWPLLKTETIDYGVMEGARHVAVIPAEGLNWSDVGSWDALFDLLPADETGNIVMGGKHIGVETQNSLVYVNQEHRLIVTIGVNDLVVVDTGDVLLVCRKEQAQKVRQVVERLKNAGQEYI
jgi:mannose-1-phosphate guanylyltransferase